MARRRFLLSLGSALVGAGLVVGQSPSLPPEPIPSAPVPELSIPDPAPPAEPIKAPAEPIPTTPTPSPSVPPASLPGTPILSVDDAVPAAAPRLTLEADYLLWWLKAAPTPPLITSSTDPADSGIIGNRTTTVLFGGRDTQYGVDSGLRLFLDYRLNDVWSVQLGGFLMEQQARGLTAASDANGSPAVAIPFIDSFDGRAQSSILAVEGALAGSASVRIDNRLWGLEANASGLTYDCGDLRVNLLGGFRHVNLQERLTLNTTSTLLFTPGIFDGNFVNPGTTITGFDDFGTSNQFYGGQLGFDAEWHRGAFFVGAFTKVGLGFTHERSNITGNSRALQPGGPNLVAVGDVLAASSNVGTLRDDRFSVVPEVGINVGLQLNDHLRVHAGYQFLYWSDVLRAGDQIDRQVNVNLIPTQNLGFNFGPQVPSPGLRHTDFWAQGLNFGLKLGW